MSQALSSFIGLYFDFEVRVRDILQRLAEAEARQLLAGEVRPPGQRRREDSLRAGPTGRLTEQPEPPFCLISFCVTTPLSKFCLCGNPFVYFLYMATPPSNFFVWQPLRLLLYMARRRPPPGSP